MRKPPVLCYITDRNAFAGSESTRREALLLKIAEAARAGINLVQLREKDLSGRELEELTSAAVEVIRREASPGADLATTLLVNGRVDVALATGADGVHLPADDLSPAEARSIWAHARPSPTPVLSISCHTMEDIRAAATAHVDFALFAPVFGKKDAPGVAAAGLAALREASLAPVQVLALGGVTLANARACLEAGAAGIAGIRLFQEGDIARVARELRANALN
jgi:thiamine-phosphate pyrophosphorylase